MSMPRRIAVSATAGFVSSLILPALRAQNDSGASAPLTVDFHLGGDAPDAAMAILRGVDAKNVLPVKERGLGGVETVVACVLAAKGLASAIIKLLPTLQCGISVDMRPARVLAKNNRDVPPGTVVVIRPDNTRREFKKASSSDLTALAASFERPK